MRGVSQHIRIGTRCFPETHPQNEEQARGAAIINNLLYFTLIRNDAPPREDDDFSTLSGHEVQRYQVPNEVLAVDENQEPREDGRQRNLIQFAQGLVEANRPRVPRPIVRFLDRSTTFVCGLFNHWLRWYTIFFFASAITYCHRGECAAHVNYFFTDSDRVKQVWRL